ncbi:hypothetical protein P7C70_g3348, partial [Phenoliferia sp. Uapishka_3]
MAYQQNSQAGGGFQAPNPYGAPPPGSGSPYPGAPTGSQAPYAGAPGAQGGYPQQYGQPQQQQQYGFGGQGQGQQYPPQGPPQGQQQGYPSHQNQPVAQSSQYNQYQGQAPPNPAMGQYGAPQGQGYPQQNQSPYGSRPSGEAASFYGQQPPQGQGQGQYGGAAPPQGQGYGQGGPQQQGGPPQQGEKGALGVAAAGGAAYLAYQAYGAYSNSGSHQGQMFGASHQAAGPGAANDPNYLLNILRQCVHEQKLSAFYGAGSLEQISQKVVREQSLQRIAQQWQIPIEAAIDLVRLALFDIILYCDDSGSMSFEEKGSRIEDLKMIVSRTAYAASFFDQDGIQIRFMNSKIEAASNTEAAALNIIKQVQFNGMTPLGTSLKKKVLEPLVLHPAKHGQLRKPVLIVIITDGAPSGEDRHKIVKVIKEANHDLQKTKYGPDAVSYQLAQVGNDLAARKFLEEIDVDREVGQLIDVTSNYENEADNLRKARNPINLTPSLWLIKLLLGGISSAYDFKDESPYPTLRNMSIPKVLLILGFGGNIGAATAKKFAARGYKVAIAARSLTAGTSKEGYTTINFDGSQPATVKEAFKAARAAVGTPTVVLYNAYSHIQTPEPFSIPIEEFASSLAINVTSPYSAASEALAGLEDIKKAGSDLTVLYTGNGLNAVRFSSTLALGVGKNASLHWIQIGADIYGEKGAKFYFVDERLEGGAVAGKDIDGEAHAVEFLKLAENKEQQEPIYTFVKGVGYEKF